MFRSSRSSASSLSKRNPEKSSKTPSLTESAIRFIVGQDEAWEDMDARSEARSKASSHDHKKRHRRHRSRSDSRERSTRSHKEEKRTDRLGRDKTEDRIVGDDISRARNETARKQDDSVLRKVRSDGGQYIGLSDRTVRDSEPFDRPVSSHIQDQFPGHDPVDYAHNPYTQVATYIGPLSSGSAADYYDGSSLHSHGAPSGDTERLLRISKPPSSASSRPNKNTAAPQSSPSRPGQSSISGSATAANGRGEAASYYDTTIPMMPVTVSQPPLMHSISSPAVPTASYYAPPPSSTNPPSGIHTAQPLYAAAGAAGLVAGAYAAHNHHQASSPGPYVNGAYPDQASLYTRHSATSNTHDDASLATHRQHGHRGPLDRLLDLVQNQEDVRKMEEYTEYIGVCRHCFDPRSSPYDAPRPHHFDGRRSSDSLRRRSNESLKRAQTRGAKHSRIDKESRYYSSDNGKRNKRSSWLGAGIAGYGLAKVGGALWNNKRDFEDTYSLKSGRRDKPPSYSSRPSQPTERGHVHPDHEFEPLYVRHNDGSVSKQSNHNHRSQSHSRDRRSSGAASATLPSVIGSSHRSHDRYSQGYVVRHHEQGKDHSSHGNSNRRRSSRSSSDSGNYSPGLGEILGFTSPRRSRRRRSPNTLRYGKDAGGSLISSRPSRAHQERRKKDRGFFNFGNDSSSSSGSGLAFGSTVSKRRPSPKRRSRRNSRENLDTTLLGIGATAAALAAVRSGRQRPEVIAVRERKDKKSSRSTRAMLGRPASRDDDDWESASEGESSGVSSGMAFGEFDHKGKLPRHRASMESLTSQSSGTSKWGWRWGRKPKKSSRALPQLPVSGERPDLTGHGRVASSMTLPLEHDRATVTPSNMPPMQYLPPEPLRDETPTRSSFTSPIPMLSSRSDSMPLQQPQPVMPVQDSVYVAENHGRPSYYSSPGPSAHAQSQMETPSRRRADSIPSTSNFGRDAILAGAAATAVTAGILASSRGKGNKDDSPSNVRFDLTEKQTRKQERAERDRRSKVEAAHAAPDSDHQQLEKSERRKKEDLHQRAESTRHEAEQQAELDKDLERQHREDLRRVEQMNRDRAIEVQIEQKRRELERRKHANGAWEVPIAAGLASAAVGAGMAHRADLDNQDNHSNARYDAKPIEPDNLGYSGQPITDDDIFDPNFFKRKRSKSELDRQREEAERIVSEMEHRYTSPQPTQAQFFAPEELSQPARGKTAAVDPTEGMNGNDYYAEYMPEIDHSEQPRHPDIVKAKKPWDVPTLNVIGPTPPTSIAGSVRGQKSPDISPIVADDEEVDQAEPGSEKNSRVSWGPDDTRTYEIESPEPSPRVRPHKPSPLHEVVVKVESPGEEHTTRYTAEELPSTTSNPARDHDVVQDSRSIEDPVASGGRSFYRTPFAETVSDLGFTIDSPGTEGAPPVQGYILGETDEPTPVEEKVRHIPGGFESEPATPQDAGPSSTVEPAEAPDTWEPPLSKKEKKKREKAAKWGLTEDDSFIGSPLSKEVFAEPPPPSNEDYFGSQQEASFEPILSKKDKKKREKAASRVSLGDNTEVTTPIYDEPSPSAEVNQAAEEDDQSLSKKDRKKRDKEKRRSLADEPIVEDLPTPQPANETQDDAPAIPLSKKEQKKRDKAAKLAGFEDSAPVTPANEVADEWEVPLSSKDRKKREKAAQNAALQESEPTTPAAAAQTDEWDVPMSSKERKKREKAAQSAAMQEPEPVLSAVAAEPTDEWDVPMSSKEKKKRAKEAKKNGFGDVAAALLAGGVAGAVLDEISDRRPDDREQVTEGTASDSARTGSGSHHQDVDDLEPRRRTVSIPVNAYDVLLQKQSSTEDVSRGQKDTLSEAYTGEPPTEEALSALNDEEESTESARRRKKKSRSSGDFDDSVSVASGRTSRSTRSKHDRDDESPKKEKKGGLFGLFRRKSGSEKETVIDVPQAAEDDEESEKRHRKHHRRHETGDSDSRSVTSSSRPSTKDDLDDESGHRRRRHRDNDVEDDIDDTRSQHSSSSKRADKHRHRSDTADEKDEESFLGERVEREEPPPLLASSATVLTHAPESVASHLPPLPESRPASPIEVGSTTDLPALPESPVSVSSPANTFETPRRPQLVPIRPASSTAIPLRFRRPPGSPAPSGSPNTPRERSVSFSSPTAPSPISPVSLSTPRTRQSRPRSTELRYFTEFQPLYLVEHNRKPTETVPEEQLPSLPSSKQTSRASSVHGSDGYESAVEEQAFAEHETYPYHTAVEDEHPEDGIGSGQSTPRASQFPSSIRGANRRSEPEFYSWEDIVREERLRSEAAAQSEELLDHRPCTEPVQPHVDEEDHPAQHASSHDSPEEKSTDTTVVAAMTGAAAGAAAFGAADILSDVFGDAEPESEYATPYEQRDPPLDPGNDRQLVEETPIRPSLTRASSSKGKKGKKGKQPKLGTVSLSESTEPEVLSPQEIARRRAQDTQDAVDSWFAPEEASAPKLKGKKGKKKQVADIWAPPSAKENTTAVRTEQVDTIESLRIVSPETINGTQTDRGDSDIKGPLADQEDSQANLNDASASLARAEAALAAYEAAETAQVSPIDLPTSVPLPRELEAEAPHAEIIPEFPTEATTKAVTDDWDIPLSKADKNKKKKGKKVDFWVEEPAETPEMAVSAENSSVAEQSAEIEKAGPEQVPMLSTATDASELTTGDVPTDEVSTLSSDVVEQPVADEWLASASLTKSRKKGKKAKQAQPFSWETDAPSPVQEDLVNAEATEPQPAEPIFETPSKKGKKGKKKQKVDLWADEPAAPPEGEDAEPAKGPLPDVGRETPSPNDTHAEASEPHSSIVDNVNDDIASKPMREPSDENESKGQASSYWGILAGAVAGAVTGAGLHSEHEDKSKGESDKSDDKVDHQAASGSPQVEINESSFLAPVEAETLVEESIEGRNPDELPEDDSVRRESDSYFSLGRLESGVMSVGVDPSSSNTTQPDEATPTSPAANAESLDEKPQAPASTQEAEAPMEEEQDAGDDSWFSWLPGKKKNKKGKKASKVVEQTSELAESPVPQADIEQDRQDTADSHNASPIERLRTTDDVARIDNEHPAQKEPEVLETQNHPAQQNRDLPTETELAADLNELTGPSGKPLEHHADATEHGHILATDDSETMAQPRVPEEAADDEWASFSTKKPKKGKKSKKSLLAMEEPVPAENETTDSAATDAGPQIHPVEPSAELAVGPVEPAELAPDDEWASSSIKKSKKGKKGKKSLLATEELPEDLRLGEREIADPAAIDAEPPVLPMVEPAELAGGTAEPAEPVLEDEWASFSTKKSKKGRKGKMSSFLPEDPEIAMHSVSTSGPSVPVPITDVDHPGDILAEPARLSESIDLTEPVTAAVQPDPTEPAAEDEWASYSTKKSKKGKKGKKTSLYPDEPEAVEEPVSVAEQSALNPIMDLEDSLRPSADPVETLESTDFTEVATSIESAEPVEAAADDEWASFSTKKSKKGKKGKQSSSTPGVTKAPDRLQAFDEIGAPPLTTAVEDNTLPARESAETQESTEATKSAAETTESAENNSVRPLTDSLETLDTTEPTEPSEKTQPTELAEPAAEDEWASFSVKKSKKNKKGKQSLTGSTVIQSSDDSKAKEVEQPDDSVVDSITEPAAPPTPANEDDWTTLATKKNKKNRKGKQVQWESEPISRDQAAPETIGSTVEAQIATAPEAAVEDEWSSMPSKKSTKGKKGKQVLWKTDEDRDAGSRATSGEQSQPVESDTIQEDQTKSPVVEPSADPSKSGAVEGVIEDEWSSFSTKKSKKDRKKDNIATSVYSGVDEKNELTPMSEPIAEDLEARNESQQVVEPAAAERFATEDLPVTEVPAEDEWATFTVKPSKKDKKKAKKASSATNEAFDDVLGAREAARETDPTDQLEDDRPRDGMMADEENFTEAKSTAVLNNTEPLDEDEWSSFTVKPSKKDKKKAEKGSFAAFETPDEGPQVREADQSTQMDYQEPQDLQQAVNDDFAEAAVTDAASATEPAAGNQWSSFTFKPSKKDKKKAKKATLVAQQDPEGQPRAQILQPIEQDPGDSIQGNKNITQVVEDMSTPIPATTTEPAPEDDWGSFLVNPSKKDKKKSKRASLARQSTEEDNLARAEPDSVEEAPLKEADQTAEEEVSPTVDSELDRETPIEHPQPNSTFDQTYENPPVAIGPAASATAPVPDPEDEWASFSMKTSKKDKKKAKKASLAPQLTGEEGLPLPQAEPSNEAGAVDKLEAAIHLDEAAVESPIPTIPATAEATPAPDGEWASFSAKTSKKDEKTKKSSLARQDTEKADTYQPQGPTDERTEDFEANAPAFIEESINESAPDMSAAIAPEPEDEWASFSTKTSKKDKKRAKKVALTPPQLEETPRTATPPPEAQDLIASESLEPAADDGWGDFLTKKTKKGKKAAKSAAIAAAALVTGAIDSLPREGETGPFENQDKRDLDADRQSNTLDLTGQPMQEEKRDERVEVDSYFENKESLTGESQPVEEALSVHGDGKSVFRDPFAQGESATRGQLETRESDVISPKGHSLYTDDEQPQSTDDWAGFAPMKSKKGKKGKKSKDAEPYQARSMEQTIRVDESGAEPASDGFHKQEGERTEDAVTKPLPSLEEASQGDVIDPEQKASVYWWSGTEPPHERHQSPNEVLATQPEERLPPTDLARESETEREQSGHHNVDEPTSLELKPSPLHVETTGFGDWSIDPLLETSTETPDEMWARMSSRKKKGKKAKRGVVPELAPPRESSSRDEHTEASVIATPGQPERSRFDKPEGPQVETMVNRDLGSTSRYETQPESGISVIQDPEHHVDTWQENQGSDMASGSSRNDEGVMGVSHAPVILPMTPSFDDENAPLLSRAQSSLGYQTTAASEIAQNYDPAIESRKAQFVTDESHAVEKRGMDLSDTSNVDISDQRPLPVPEGDTKTELIASVEQEERPAETEEAEASPFVLKPSKKDKKKSKKAKQSLWNEAPILGQEATTVQLSDDPVYSTAPQMEEERAVTDAVTRDRNVPDRRVHGDIAPIVHDRPEPEQEREPERPEMSRKLSKKDKKKAKKSKAWEDDWEPPATEPVLITANEPLQNAQRDEQIRDLTEVVETPLAPMEDDSFEVPKKTSKKEKRKSKKGKATFADDDDEGSREGDSAATNERPPQAAESEIMEVDRYQNHATGSVSEQASFHDDRKALTDIHPESLEAHPHHHLHRSGSRNLGLLPQDVHTSPERLLETGSTSPHDVDFAATLAAGLGESGFDPDLVINDPAFHRRASPPGMAEADPEEEFTTMDKKGKKNKKRKDVGQKTAEEPQEQQVKQDDDAMFDPAARRAIELADEESKPANKTDDGFDAVLAAGLGAAGFTAADMLGRSSDTRGKAAEEPEDYFTVPIKNKKKKKGKETAQVLDAPKPPTPSATTPREQNDVSDWEKFEVAEGEGDDRHETRRANERDDAITAVQDSVATRQESTAKDEWAVPSKKKGKKGKASRSSALQTPDATPAWSTADEPVVKDEDFAPVLKKKGKKNKKGTAMNWDDDGEDNTRSMNAIDPAINDTSNPAEKNLSAAQGTVPGAFASDWSFDNIRDSGLPMDESPTLPAGELPRNIIRDSGYDTTNERSNRNSSETHVKPIAERSAAADPPGTTDWDLPVKKGRPKGKKADRTSDVIAEPRISTLREEVPLSPESTTKNRTSYLFQTPPTVERPSTMSSTERHIEREPQENMDYFSEHARDMTFPSSPIEDNKSPIESRTAVVPYVPMESPVRKRSKAKNDIGAPEHHVKAARRTATPLQPFREQHESTSSPGQTSMTNQSRVEDINRRSDVGRRLHSELRSPDALSHVSGGSLYRLRTPDQFRSASVASNTSRTSSQSLRRTDRSMSGDLRAASRRGEAQPNQSSSANNQHEPLNTRQHSSFHPPLPYQAPLTPPLNEDEAGVRMDNVYEGWGDGERAAVSPTRPPSMRKRQSMHVIDLEARLEQLAEENRQLHAARGDLDGVSAEEHDSVRQALQASKFELQQKDAQIHQIRALLEPLQHEIARLTEANGDLSESNRNLVADTNNRYATLQAEHSQSVRELDNLRREHGQLSGGMEDIVRQHIDTALEDKNAEIRHLREELDLATDQIRALQSQIQSTATPDFLTTRDEDYFDAACQKLCQHLQQWVLRFSKTSDNRACRLSTELKDDKIETRLDNTMLDGSDVDKLLADRIRRRDVFMALSMAMVWEYIFTRYLFGMDREQRQKLKTLEKVLLEVGPPRAVAQWRATTLTLLSRRPAFTTQRNLDTEAVTHELFAALSSLLPPPKNAEPQLLMGLKKVLTYAIDLSIEMRTQRADYFMLPPPTPEYDSAGDLVRKTRFDAATMNERSGEYADNGELQDRAAVVKMVLFPLVMKRGDELGEGGEETVICPAQVLVAGTSGKGKVVRVRSGAINMDIDAPGSAGRRSVMSMGTIGEGGMI